MSQQELGQRLGQGKLEARTICRNLDRRGLVVTIMKDIGRQRVTNFVAKKFETVSQGAVQYQVLLVKSASNIFGELNTNIFAGGEGEE